jgi:hypothetical protein
LAKASDVAIAIAVLGILGLIVYGGLSLSKWFSSLKLPSLSSLFGFGSGGSNGSSGSNPFSSPSGEAFLLSSPFTAPLALDLWAENLLKSMQKPKSYTAPALTSSWQEAYQKTGIQNPEQYVQQLQSWVYAEAPSTYQQYQGQYVGYGAE